MKRTLIKHLLAQKEESATLVLVQGWVRTRRDSKAFSFLELNDGSCLANIQIIADAGIPGYDTITKMTTGAAVGVTGHVVKSQGKGQSWEVRATAIELVGEAPDDFPLQKKGHSAEFLREIAHLRPRTNLYGAVFRMRSQLSRAVHNFFAQRDFVHVHTPILTASDCEGAGEMFRVTTGGKEEFFGRPTHLTVSGQLEGELFATALSQIYTFGPTFRAENSHTSRHAAEFWMIEPEMAFCDLEGDMDLAEDFLKSVIGEILKVSSEDLAFLDRFVERGLLQRLETSAKEGVERVTYTEAVQLLQESGESFKYPVEYGANLQSEHERWLTEKHFEKSVIVYNYPREIKPFYMRRNNDGKTAAAMDLLVPGIGELIGGSQREERLDQLKANMQEHGLSEDEYWWYLDTRKFGSVPHAGFGVGFERLLMFVTGIKNIRDVIPFPRTPGHCEF